MGRSTHRRGDRGPACSCLYSRQYRRSVRRRFMTTKHTTMRALVLGTLIALGAAGCASGPPANYAGNRPERTATQSISDGALSAKIKTSFATDSGGKAGAIKVDSIAGVVPLTGTGKTAPEPGQAISVPPRTKA